MDDNNEQKQEVNSSDEIAKHNEKLSNLQNVIKAKENELQKITEDVKKKKAMGQQTIKGMKDSMVKQNDELSKVDDEIKAKQGEFQKITGQMVKHSQSLSKVKDDIKAKETELQQITEKIRDNQSNLQEDEKELKCLTEKITEAEQKHSLLANEFDNLEKTRQLNFDLQCMVTKEHKKNEENTKQIEELSNTCKQLKEDNKSKGEKIDELSKKEQMMREQYSKYKIQVEAELAKFKANVETQQMTIRARDAIIESQKTEIGRLQGCVVELKGDIQKLSIDFREKDAALQKELLEHQKTKTTLMQHIEDIIRLNSKLESDAKEIEMLQDETNKARVYAREIQLKYKELPEKEEQFNRIQKNNNNLWEENAELKEQIMELARIQTTLSFLKDQNEALSNDNERLKERNKYIEDKYMTQMRQFEQQTEEVQELRGDRVQLRQRLKQKTDENGSLKQRLQQSIDKIENLQKDLSGSPSRLCNSRSLEEDLSTGSANQSMSPQQASFGQPLSNDTGNVFNLSPRAFNFGTNAASTPTAQR